MNKPTRTALVVATLPAVPALAEGLSGMAWCACLTKNVKTRA